MQRFYSQATGTTYFREVHRDIPDDALPISDERYEEVIINPAPDKLLAHDNAGLPILIDPLPATAEELAASERQWRDAKIESMRWLRERHRDEVDSARPATLSAKQSGELLEYVQLLRDGPISPDFPDSKRRPAAPLWISEQTLYAWRPILP